MAPFGVFVLSFVFVHLLRNLSFFASYVVFVFALTFTPPILVMFLQNCIFSNFLTLFPKPSNIQRKQPHAIAVKHGMLGRLIRGDLINKQNEVDKTLVSGIECCLAVFQISP